MPETLSQADVRGSARGHILAGVRLLASCIDAEISGSSWSGPATYPRRALIAVAATGVASPALGTFIPAL
jgi:hypothetical protein